MTGSTQYVDIRGGKLAVVIYEPEVHQADAILIHGYTGSKEDFSLIGPLLAQRGYRVLTSDNRGQHESSHSTDATDYSIRALASDHKALADHFGLKRPHIFGHSFGGLVAQRAVVDYPETWSSLSLFCSGPHGMPEWGKLAEDIEYLNHHSMAELWVANGESQKPGNEAGSLKQRRWFSTDKLSIQVHAHHLMTEPSVVSEVVATGLPVQVIRGEHDDAWPHELQAQMAAAYGVEVQLIPNAGHCPNEDQPLSTSEVIVEFWNNFH